MTTIDEIISRWDSGEGKPFKGSLIDWSAYGGNGTAPPDDIGCMCAQGQVLHLIGGWTPGQLYMTSQREADVEAAKLLGISVTHAVLLRQINDNIDGAPSIVITEPEKVLGPNAPAVLKFWDHLDGMSAAARAAARAAAWDAARAAAWEAARAAAREAARAAAREAAREAARAAARAAAWTAAWAAAWDAAWEAARAAAGAAAWAGNEIQGAAVYRARGAPPFFLPLFGLSFDDLGI